MNYLKLCLSKETKDSQKLCSVLSANQFGLLIAKTLKPMKKMYAVLSLVLAQQRLQNFPKELSLRLFSPQINSYFPE